MSEVKDLYCGYSFTDGQKEMIYWLTMAEFAKPKCRRTTPYLLAKKVKNRIE